MVHGGWDIGDARRGTEKLKSKKKRGTLLPCGAHLYACNGKARETGGGERQVFNDSRLRREVAQRLCSLEEKTALLSEHSGRGEKNKKI